MNSLKKIALQAPLSQPGLSGFIYPVTSLEDLQLTMAEERANDGPGELSAYEDQIFKYQDRYFTGPELAEEMAQSQTFTAPAMSLAPAMASKTVKSIMFKLPLPGKGEEPGDIESASRFDYERFLEMFWKNSAAVAAAFSGSHEKYFGLNQEEASQWLGKNIGHALATTRKVWSTPEKSSNVISRKLGEKGFRCWVQINEETSQRSLTCGLIPERIDEFRQEASRRGYKFNPDGTVTSGPSEAAPPTPPVPPAPEAALTLVERIERSAVAMQAVGADVVEVLSLVHECPDCVDAFLKELEQ